MGEDSDAPAAAMGDLKGRKKRVSTGTVSTYSTAVSAAWGSSLLPPKLTTRSNSNRVAADLGPESCARSSRCQGGRVAWLWAPWLRILYAAVCIIVRVLQARQQRYDTRVRQGFPRDKIDAKQPRPGARTDTIGANNSLSVNQVERLKEVLLLFGLQR